MRRINSIISLGNFQDLFWVLSSKGKEPLNVPRNFYSLGSVNHISLLDHRRLYNGSHCSLITLRNCMRRKKLLFCRFNLTEVDQADKNG